MVLPYFLEVYVLNKDLTKEQIEDIRERVKSGLNVLRSNVIGHQIILNEIRDYGNVRKGLHGSDRLSGRIKTEKAYQLSL